MDPLSTLNIAAAVATFVELGGSILKASREIRHSAQGQTKHEANVLETISRLSILCTELEKLRDNAPTTASVNEVVIQELCKKARELAQELRDTLGTASTQSNNRKKWNTLRHAIRSVWSESKIREKEAELAKISQELHLYLTACLKDKQSDINKQLAAIIKNHHELEMRSINEVQSCRESLMRAVQEGNARVQGDIRDMNLLCQELWRTKEKATRAMRDQRYLKSLYFSELNSRRQSIKETHTSTFDWMFNTRHADRPVLFSDWLRNSNGVYWITGKAGCGKSTLMKHISESSLTHKHLTSWSGSRTLVVAKFFFWRPGCRIGKSLEGLLRALLYEIFRQCPHLIPGSDDATSMDLEDEVTTTYWTVDSLMKIIESIGRDPRTSVAYTFFIDGLDEYDGVPRDIARAIEALASLPNVKICVSSREWVSFADAFGKNKDAVLILQEHTNKDIELYVEETFGKDPLFETLRLENLSYRLLINEIVSKAQGVFLWVYLVVRDLTNSLSNGDTVQEMLDRIRSMPSELEDYFQFMIKSIPDFYKKDACMIFILALQAPTPLSVLTIAYVLNTDLKCAPERNAREESMWMKRRLQVRCQDLMEVFEDDRKESWATRLKINFIHRTVYDYLNERAARDAIMSHAGSDFDANKTLCEALIRQLDSLCHSGSSGGDDLEQSMLFIGHSIAYYGGQVEATDGACDYSLLESAERKMKDQALKENCNWNRALLDGDGPLRNEEIRNDEYFLIFAIRWGLCTYVSKRMKSLQDQNVSLSNIAGYSALYLALVYPMDSLGDNETASAISFPMVELLLKLGADPNQPYGLTTVWAKFLKCLSEAELTDRQNIFQILLLLLLHRADPQIKPRSLNFFALPNIDDTAPHLSTYLVSVLRKLGYTTDEIRCLNDVVQGGYFSGQGTKVWQKLQSILRSGSLSKYLQSKSWFDIFADEDTVIEPIDEEWIVVD